MMLVYCCSLDLVFYVVSLEFCCLERFLFSAFLGWADFFIFVVCFETLGYLLILLDSVFNFVVRFLALFGLIFRLCFVCFICFLLTVFL
jgi:hypothetical protein